NVVAITSRQATAEKIDGLEDPFEEEVRFESTKPPAPMATPLPEPKIIIPGVVEGPSEVRHSIGMRLAESRRAHPALWIVVALGGVLVGVAAMIFLLPKTNAKPTVQIVSVMVPAPPVPTAAGEGEGVTSVGPIEVAPGVVTKAGPSKGATKPAEPTTSTGVAAAPLSTSLTGLGGLVGGPSGPSAGPGSPGGGGGSLAQADIERVVQSHRAFIKRQCWESALAGKAPNSPSSARVVVNVNVAASGSVQSATASGADGYPGLSSCVQGQVRNWKFPPSDGAQFNVPFVFAAQ
ncbi:MAG TPA: AgmX/PglI C-terminal domain-containing protein, partial [Polyangiaceae bacterium]|nr:AgmX/PglI C-terminal domain-containing protein [Polyangiaceae bacterium]